MTEFISAEGPLSPTAGSSLQLTASQSESSCRLFSRAFAEKLKSWWAVLKEKKETTTKCFLSRRYRFVNRWRVLLGSIYNKPVNANVAEVKTIVYHSSYLPFVDPNIDDNSRDIAVLALANPLTFSGRDGQAHADDVRGPT